MNAPQANFAMTVEDADLIIEAFEAIVRIGYPLTDTEDEVLNRLREWRSRHQVGVDGD